MLIFSDEMNMHVPQSEESRVEIKELASVPSQIISPANNKPIISLVQDTCRIISIYSL